MNDKRIGFGPRLQAALIDAVAVMVLGTVFGGVLGSVLGLGAGAVAGAATGEGGAAAAAGVLGGVLGAAAGIFLVAVVYGLIEGLTGASPGKMLLKLKVGYEDGRLAPTSVYLTRWAVKNIGSLLSVSGLITGISLLGSLGSLGGFVIFIGCFMVMGEKKQAIHDLAAKTAVFKVSDLA